MRYILVLFLLMGIGSVVVLGTRGHTFRKPPVYIFPDVDRQPKLRPQEPNVVVNKNQLVFDEVRGGAASAAKTITISNTGSAALTLSGISITGADASLFSFSPSITTPASIAAGASLNINIVFNPPAANPPHRYFEQHGQAPKVRRLPIGAQRERGRAATRRRRTAGDGVRWGG
jgi:hypothetical protein